MSADKLSAWKNGRKDKIVAEKAEAEELPPGWTVDVIIRKNGSKIRKYLRQAGDEPMLPDRGTDNQMPEQQSSSSDEMKNDVQISESTVTEDHACVSRNASEPGSDVNLPEAHGSEEKEGKEITALRDDLFEANGLEKGEKKSESEEQRIVFTPSSENSRHKRSLENKSEGHKKRNKSIDKIKSTLPRRASKRLAGIKVDVPTPPLPEPKTRRQATCRWAREAKTSTTTNLATPKEHDEKAATEKTTSHEKQVDSIVSSKVERKIKLKDRQESILPLASEPGRHVDMNNKPHDKHEIPFLSPPANLSTIEESREKVKKEDHKADVKQEFPLVTPSALPVMSLSTPEVTPIVPLVSLEIEMDDKRREKQGLTVVNPPMSLPIQGNYHLESPVNFSLEDLWTDPCIEFAVKTLTGDIPIVEENKVDIVFTSPLKLPLEELWTDPCIEFAVKTLTGAIPVGEDTCVQDYLQHPAANSSDTQGESSFSFPDAGMNSFCQTEVLSKHFEITENSLHNQQQDLTMLPYCGNHGLSSEQVKGGRGKFLQ